MLVIFSISCAAKQGLILAHPESGLLMIKIMVPQAACARTIFRPRPDFGPDSGLNYGALTPCSSYELCGENLTAENLAVQGVSPWKKGLRGGNLSEEKITLESTDPWRSSSWRKPFQREGELSRSMLFVRLLSFAHTSFLRADHSTHPFCGITTGCYRI